MYKSTEKNNSKTGKEYEYKFIGETITKIWKYVEPQ